jgi:hypothetical protein
MAGLYRGIVPTVLGVVPYAGTRSGFTPSTHLLHPLDTPSAGLLHTTHPLHTLCAYLAAGELTSVLLQLLYVREHQARAATVKQPSGIKSSPLCRRRLDLARTTDVSMGCHGFYHFLACPLTGRGLWLD